MRMRFRMLRMLIVALFRKTVFNMGGESISRFIVMPWDCGLTTVTNDRYHAFMDIGRIDLVIGFGWGWILLKNRWNPFVRHVDLRYKHPLKLFQRFTLRTRIIYWDDRYFWMEHLFERNNRTVAVGISKSLARSPKGPVRPAQAIRELNRNLQCPDPPPITSVMNHIEELLKKI